MMADLDADLDEMDREALLKAARAMRRAIRDHRDASGHDLCWYHPEMWALLPDTPQGAPVVPEWDKFMTGCAAFRASLDREGAHLPRTDAAFSKENDHDQV